MKNNTKLTLLEIEQIREAAKEYAEDYIGATRHIVLEEIDTQCDGYDFTVVCVIYLQNGSTQGHVLGIRHADNGFEVPLD